MTPTRIRVLIADDHPLVRSGMRALLMASDDLEVVGEAATGEEAVSLTNELRPDVVVLDLRMPGCGGLEATRRIQSQNHGTRVLVVTLIEDDESVFAALRAGARGYVLKEASETEVLTAIRAVNAGDVIFSSGVAQQLIDFFVRPRPAASQPFPQLTEREREVLVLIARGHSNQQIADELFVSIKTIRNYISSIFSKLEVADRAQAILRAREAGLQ